NLYPFMFFVANFEYPSQRFVVHIRVRAMALVLVVPIVHKYRPAGRNPEVDPLRPEIIGIDEIFTVARRITGPGALGNIHVHPETVYVVHENSIPVEAPMLIAQVEHRTGMGVSAPGSCRPEVSGMRALVAQPMYVIGDGLDIVVSIGVEMLPTLAVVSCALNHVEHVWDNTYRSKCMTVIIERQPPRIARSLREHLKFMACGVVPPHTRVDGGPFVVRRAGLPYIGMGEYAMVTIKPAVWPPYKRVERFMCVLISPTIEQYLGLASRFVCRRIDWDIH